MLKMAQNGSIYTTNPHERSAIALWVLVGISAVVMWDGPFSSVMGMAIVSQ